MQDDNTSLVPIREENTSLEPTSAEDSNVYWKPFLKTVSHNFIQIYSGGGMQVTITILAIVLTVVLAITLSPYISLFLIVIYAFMACFQAWRDEYKQVNLLKRKLGESRFRLDIEIEDVFLATPADLQDFSTFYITVVLNVTNTKPENNTIKHCRLFVDKDIGRVEGKLNDSFYLLNLGANFPKALQTSVETIVFSQGIPQTYARTFLFEEDDSIYYDDKVSLDDKPFILQLTDSYGNNYERQGRTAKEFLKQKKSI